MNSPNAIWATRLREARLAAGLSQKQLGIEAGLDQFVASARINRYELGIHKADYQISQKLARILNVPTAYLYSDDNELAEAILLLHRMVGVKRQQVLELIKSSSLG